VTTDAQKVAALEKLLKGQSIEVLKFNKESLANFETFLEIKLDAKKKTIFSVALKAGQVVDEGLLQELFRHFAALNKAAAAEDVLEALANEQTKLQFFRKHVDRNKPAYVTGVVGLTTTAIAALIAVPTIKDSFDTWYEDTYADVDDKPAKLSAFFTFVKTSLFGHSEPTITTNALD
jgi:hypothetical protein